MEFLVERTIAILVAVGGPLLTIFDLPGNTLTLLTAFVFAFFDEAIYFNGRLLSAMVLIYAVGECWEFCVSLFGIKRKKVSWFAVFFIGAGGFIGTLLGTLIFPILGSLIGGMMGAFVTAFAYELCIPACRGMPGSWPGRRQKCALWRLSASWSRALRWRLCW